ncbi:glycosyltransferase family 4 protein [candidate division WOR-3 bacterium]|nr:glycosyltransferase family 4 protein [candidate division WOR-3 bacterium]
MKGKTKSKPGILIINWQDWTNPLSGGAEVHLHEIFRRLTEYFDITLLCTHFENAQKTEEIDGIEIYRVGSRNTFNFYVPKAYRCINKSEKFDIVIEDLNKIPFFGGRFIRENRIALIHHLFGKTIFTETNPLSASYVYYSERLIPKHYKKVPIIAVSKSSKNEMVKMGVPEKNIEVVYNGVDLKNYKSKAKKSPKPTIICLNRMKKYKRMDILINSIPGVLKSIPDLKVVFVGDGDDLPRLKEVARRNKTERAIRFTDFVSAEKKADLLASSWVAVNTSPKEGWGLTSIEAQSSGTPSIIPDSPGLRETVKNGVSGYIYPFGDTKMLSEILIKVLKDRKLVVEMGRQARKWAANFSWDESAKKMKGIIDKQLSRS